MSGTAPIYQTLAAELGDPLNGACCTEQTSCPTCGDDLCPDHGAHIKGGVVECDYHQCPVHADCHEAACGHLAGCGGAS